MAKPGSGARTWPTGTLAQGRQAHEGSSLLCMVPPVQVKASSPEARPLGGGSLLYPHLHGSQGLALSCRDVLPPASLGMGTPTQVTCRHHSLGLVGGKCIMGSFLFNAMKRYPSYDDCNFAHKGLVFGWGAVYTRHFITIRTLTVQPSSRDHSEPASRP